LVPIRVAPYQTEEFKPKVTFPIIVELGATNYAAYKFGYAPP